MGRSVDQNDNRLRSGNERRLIDYLKGNEEYQLFCDFAEAHLWDAKVNRPTAQGAALGSSRQQIAFGEVRHALTELSLPYSHGAAFEFTVHVIVIEKPEVPGSRTFPLRLLCARS